MNPVAKRQRELEQKTTEDDLCQVREVQRAAASAQARMPVLVKVRPSSGERGAASCYWCAGKAAKGSSIEVTASLKTQVTKLEKLLASEQD